MKKLTVFLMLLATASFANGKPEPKTEKPEPGKASAATSVDTCTVPTSVKPADYPADAKTWPCKNFSK